jgi:sec-independent protein translocase protein TatA
MGISIWQLLIILAIVLLLFGAKRLRNLGTDLGASVRGFRDAMRDNDKPDEQDKRIEQNEGRVIDAEVSDITPDISRDISKENRKI